jgi:hypothetical protein
LRCEGEWEVRSRVDVIELTLNFPSFLYEAEKRRFEVLRRDCISHDISSEMCVEREGYEEGWWG